MKAALIFAVCILTALTAVAGSKPTLEEARKQFDVADALLNKAYKSVCAELSKEQMVALRGRQREWIQYRDQKAESLLWFNGVKTDEPKERAEYWTYKASLTEDRVEFLRVFTGAAVSKGISGKYRDFWDGDLSLEETKMGIVFSMSVIRGPSAHGGEISGVAQRKGDKAVYREVVEKGADRKACEITFSFIDGHIVKVSGKNTDYYHGMGVSFDGLYFKTK